MANRHRLKNISLAELSLVDKGANQHALQVLRKRHEQGESVVGRLLKRLGFGAQDEETTDDLDEMAGALSISIGDILEKSAPEDLEDNLTETLEQFKVYLLSKATAGADDTANGMDDQEDELEGTNVGAVPVMGTARPKKVKKDGEGQPNHEDTDMSIPAAILKGLTPEAQAYVAQLEKKNTDNTKGLESVTKLANDLSDKLANNDRREHARTLIGKSANVSLDDATALLKSAEIMKAAGDEKAVERVENLLKKQAVLIEKSALFAEDGSDVEGADGNEAEAELQKLATEIQKADPKIKFAKAYAMACERNPELYEDALGVNETAE